MNAELEKIKDAVTYLLGLGITKPECGVVLGTGLSQFIGHMKIEYEVDYNDLPHFPTSTVEFHKGKLIYGRIGERQVLAMQGRFHFYEGYTFKQITFPIRVMKVLGIQNLLLSNAAGGINPAFQKGDLVMIDDHINLLPGNPLIGKNVDEFGPRFPDMSQPYSGLLNSLLERAALESGLQLKKGTYASVSGPNLETRAEYRFLRTIGADMVGMSTVPEVIVSNHMSLPCAAISVITDECDPDHLQPVNIEEIIEVAGKADAKLSAIFAETIRQL